MIKLHAPLFQIQVDCKSDAEKSGGDPGKNPATEWHVPSGRPNHNQFGAPVVFGSGEGWGVSCESASARGWTDGGRCLGILIFAMAESSPESAALHRGKGRGGTALLGLAIEELARVREWECGEVSLIRGAGRGRGLKTRVGPACSEISGSPESGP